MNWRIAGLSCAQPCRISAIIASRASTSSLIADDAPALREGAIEDEMRHPFRVARRIGHRRRTALRAPHEGEPIEAERVDDRFEIANERIDGELRTVPIRKTVAALVVVDEAMVLGELFGPVAPHRAVPS